MRYKQTEENVTKFKEAIAESKSIAEVINRIGWYDCGGSRYRVKKWIKDLSLTTEHFTGKLWSKGKTSLSDNRLIRKNGNPFIEKSTTKREHIKKLILAEKLIDYKCCECGITTEWNNKPITLELDHINGINNDNRLENLRFLCPNCHSQTHTFKGRDIKKECIPDEDIIRLSNGAKTIRQALLLCGLSPEGKNYDRIKRLLPELIPNKHKGINSKLFINGQHKIVKEKSIYNGSNKSPEWEAKIAEKNFERRKVKDRPSKEELATLIEEMSMANIGKKYGVAGNSVKKWCKSYGITPKSCGYWAKIYGQTK